ncbi:alpha/beta hydrolase [Nocardia xishanensis]
MSATVLPVSVDAPVADGGLLPVVIWSPALGTPRWIASGLLMDLASRGYVVVAIDHTGESPAVEVGGRVEGLYGMGSKQIRTPTGRCCCWPWARWSTPHGRPPTRRS